MVEDPFSAHMVGESVIVLIATGIAPAKNMDVYRDIVKNVLDT